VPWLEPDIVDHLDALYARGVRAVVVAPIGFVSDHVEVIWDLDTEAREHAEELGMGFARAATAGPDPRFADMVADLVAEHLHEAAPRALGDVPAGGCTVNGAPCAVDCCQTVRRPA
jgi:ferrochelatase